MQKHGCVPQSEDGSTTNGTSKGGYSKYSKKDDEPNLLHLMYPILGQTQNDRLWNLYFNPKPVPYPTCKLPIDRCFHETLLTVLASVRFQKLLISWCTNSQSPNSSKALHIGFTPLWVGAKTGHDPLALGETHRTPWPIGSCRRSETRPRFQVIGLGSTAVIQSYQLISTSPIRKISNIQGLKSWPQKTWMQHLRVCWNLKFLNFTSYLYGAGLRARLLAIVPRNFEGSPRETRQKEKMKPTRLRILKSFKK